MSEVLRLKGETIHGETREFPANFVVAIDGENGNWRVADGAKTCVIDPATIQPADDPRKAMLEEILAKLKTLRWWPHFEDFKDLALVSLADVEDILHEHEITVTLDEMEAKL